MRHRHDNGGLLRAMVITCSPEPKSASGASGHAHPVTLRVLVLEADRVQRETIVEALARHGYSVAGGGTADALYELPAGTHFDIALVDQELPGEDTLSLMARLRQIQPDIGIALLSARHNLDDRIAAYRHGADLSLGKPAEPAELCAALDALGRRLKVNPAAGGGGLTLELASCLLHVPGGSLSLRRQEVEVLYALALAPGNFLESWQLLERLGKPLDIYGKAQLEVLISRLRSRLKSLPPGSNPIRAERGRGYRLTLAMQVQR
ncbi:DNA-binding response regulator, OmpR family, contains REC and winged-helix (wHTH) domain [Pseudomonas linyingensis]|uniref:DNA-binding response regulator, OmpR family, contains REC and winged-helix (WHTH) domain n=2 Tax=Pseudomonas linyingensis TaxID=915471 RepID=A0A1H6XAK6_9PSED|nr:DNA-binding response regulator, OmpR family, contains REC and winged-helix (wHTH) domain [Pseudomonas linyingensis]